MAVTIKPETKGAFFFLCEPDFFNDLDDAIKSANANFSSVALSLRENLSSAIQVASLPYTLTNASVHSRRFQAVLTAERIRAQGIDGSDAERETAAAKKAGDRIISELNSPEMLEWAINNILHELEEGLANSEFAEASQELLRQSVVAIWGSFEVFVADAVVFLLNKNPLRAAQLIRHEKTRSYFPTKGISIDLIQDHGFDLNEAMGKILFSEQKFESLTKMKDIFEVLFPNREELHKVMAGQALYLLWQRRHLIAHRRGIVDATFLSKTSDSAPLGSKLKIDSYYLDEALTSVKSSAVEVIKAVAEL